MSDGKPGRGRAGSSVEIVDDLDRLPHLGDGWRRLAEQSGNAFLTPEWYFAWLHHYGEGAAPAVAVRQDAAGELLGVAPLVASGRPPLRTVRFAGAPLGDVFHPLPQGDDPELVSEALVLLRRQGERGALVLDKVEADSPWVRALAGHGETVTVKAHLDAVLPEIEIADLSWEEYLAGRSRNLRSQLGRRRRKLERDHELGFRPTDATRLDTDLEAFFRLHRQRWAERGGSSALDDRSIAFHSEFARAALERGWLRLWTMAIDGEPAAAWYGWRLGDRYSYYLAGFDERFASFSIGTLLLAHTIRSAIEEGASVYDLLLGDEEFKFRFATGERRVRSLIVAPRTHPVRALALAELQLRQALERLSPAARTRVKRSLRGVAARLRLSPER